MSSSKTDDDRETAKSITYQASSKTWASFDKQFQAYLVGRELDYVIEHAADTLATCDSDADLLKERKRYRKRDDAKVQGVLLSKVGPSIFKSIASLGTAKEMYEYLKKTFHAETLAATIGRLTELLDLKFVG
jgi:hypothetical protein